jgi:hypothetical protein
MTILDSILLVGSGRHKREIQGVCPLFHRFIAMSTGQMAKPIFTLNGSNTLIWHKEVPLGGLSLNENFTRNFNFLVSCRSGPVKWASMQAYVVQG